MLASVFCSWQETERKFRETPLVFSTGASALTQPQSIVKHLNVVTEQNECNVEVLVLMYQEHWLWTINNRSGSNVVTEQNECNVEVLVLMYQEHWLWNINNRSEQNECNVEVLVLMCQEHWLWNINNRSDQTISSFRRIFIKAEDLRRDVTQTRCEIKDHDVIKGNPICGVHRRFHIAQTYRVLLDVTTDRLVRVLSDYLLSLTLSELKKKCVFCTTDTWWWTLEADWAGAGEELEAVSRWMSPRRFNSLADLERWRRRRLLVSFWGLALSCRPATGFVLC
ncbi:hypothetical protein J6590_066336 [Homalodisca vitripennis]|nr:hypothetical protein J6590_066336 [Homalodisca vitripennis]